jgi:hypothetical protein
VDGMWGNRGEPPAAVKKGGRESPQMQVGQVGGLFGAGRQRTLSSLLSSKIGARLHAERGRAKAGKRAGRDGPVCGGSTGEGARWACVCV